MTPDLPLVYLMAAVGLSLTPGPNGLLVMTHGMVYGFRPTVLTALGGAAGFLLLIAASPAESGVLPAASQTGFLVMKICGALYLAYLGIRLWTDPPARFVRNKDQIQIGKAGSGFRRGFLVALSNPKALIFFAAFLTQFMVPGRGYWRHLPILVGTFVVVELLYELVLAGLADGIAPALTRYGQWLNRITGSFFFLIAAALLRADRG